jgi:hypothetical protein
MATGWDWNTSISTGASIYAGKIAQAISYEIGWQLNYPYLGIYMRDFPPEELGNFALALYAGYSNHLHIQQTEEPYDWQENPACHAMVEYVTPIRNNL